MTEILEQTTIVTAVQDFLNHCRFERKLDEKTINAYRFDLKQFIAELEENATMVDVTRDYLKHWVTSLSEYHYKTIKRKIAAVNVFLHYLEGEYEDYNNPMRSLQFRMKAPVRLPVVMTREEVGRILDQLDTETKAEKDDPQYRFFCVRNQAIIELLFGSGMRIGELCGLRNKDVDMQLGQIRILGKGNKERVVDICIPVILHALRQWIAVRRSKGTPEEHFFTSHRGQGLSPQTIRALVRRLIQECHIDKHVTPHTFRHTFATLLLEEDVDIAYIQHILGHSSISTTQIYLHVNPLRQREILTNRHPRSRM